MKKENTLKQGLNQKPIQDKPQQETKKKQNPFLIILAIFLMLIFTSLVSYVAYIFGKETGKKEGLKTSTEITPDNDTIEEENDTTTSENTDSYEGWQTCENANWILSAKHPSDWKCEQVNEDGYDLYYFVLSKNDKKITFISEYSYSPSEDNGCITNPIDITEIEFGGIDYKIQYCKESSLPQIFKQISYDDFTPPDIFYIVGTGFSDPAEEEINTLKLIFDSLSLKTS